MRGNERIEESLCEKSMKVVANVIRLSAFSIAKRSLGSTGSGGPVASSRNFQPATETLNMVAAAKPLLRAQKPQTSSNQTYYVEPDGVKGSSYVVMEDMNVDGRASDYIRKVREKNQKDLFVISEASSYKLARSHVVK